MKSYIINRIKEPSTWAALSAIGVLFGLPAGAVDGIAQIMGGVAALIGVLVPENSNV